MADHPEAPPPELDASPWTARVATAGAWFLARTWRTILLFLLIAVPINFLGLGATDAVTMEGIVADGARLMARTGQYMVQKISRA